MSLSLVACAWLALNAGLAVAQADPLAEAKRRYEHALALYESGQFDAALVELQRVQQLHPSPTLLYNIGQVHLARQDFAAAVVTFRRYLEQGATRIPGNRRDEVRAQLRKLESRVARVDVAVDVGSAEILVDHRPRASDTRRASLLVNAGVRLISVRHARFPAQHQQINVAGGDALTVRFGLRSGAPVAVERSDPLPAASRKAEGDGLEATEQADARGDPGMSLAMQPAETWSGRRLRLWLGWGTTGLLALGAGVFGILASSADSDLADMRAVPVGDADALQAEANRARAFAIASDLCLVGALAAGALSLVWTLSDDEEEAPGLVRSRVGIGPGGVQLHVQY